MATYATVGSVGLVGAVPVVTAVFLWIAVLAGVASPLGRFVSENAPGTNVIARASSGGDQAGPQLPCICAATPSLQAR